MLDLAVRMMMYDRFVANWCGVVLAIAGAALALWWRWLLLRRPSAQVYVVRDGALQPVAVFSSPELAQAYIDEQPDVVGSLGPYRPDLDFAAMRVDDGSV